MKRREPKGHVEKLPSGRFRARHGRTTVGTYATRAQADAALSGATLGTWWSAWAIRRRVVVRDWPNEEGRWGLYFENDPIARVLFQELGRRHVRDWLHRMLARGLAPQTIKNAINLGRVVCHDVVDAEQLSTNPFAGVTVPRTYRPVRGETFTVLDPDEQIALLDATDDDEYHLVAFALHTGLRGSELWNLRWSDVAPDFEHFWVHRGKRGITKTGKSRLVPVIGLAKQALEHASSVRTGPWVWPSTRTGEKRFDSSMPHRWHSWVKAAGLRRRVRFYDLRHTCATSLLAGWWGRKWSLDEVRQILGHSTVKMTERYAHLVDDSVKRAGRATPGLDPTAWGENGAGFEIRTRDLRFTKALEIPGFSGVALSLHTTRWRRRAARQDGLAEAVLDALGEAYLASRDARRVVALTAALARAAELLQGAP